MRDKERVAKVLHLIYRIWNKNPELRLFQLLLGPLKDTSLDELFNLEDNILYAKLGELYGDKL